jgi:hypothetical protein
MLLSKAKNLKMEEIRRYVPVSVSSDFDSLSPHIANAEADYLIPVIGQQTYDELQLFYDSASSGSADLPEEESGSGTSEEDEAADKKKTELLRLVQSCVTHIAFWIGYDLLNSYITDDGFKRTESEKIKSLFKYQEDNLKQYFRTNGFNRLDTVLQFLEDNAQTFTTFAVSAQYTVLKSAFIPNTAAFNRIVFIGGSRLTFLRMIPHMQLIEEVEIRPLLGSVALAQLREEMLKESPRPAITGIVPIIQKAVAYLASGMLMQESGADLTDNGLYFSSQSSITGNNSEKKPSDALRIATLSERNRHIGNAFLDQVRSYLVTHAADWNDVAPSTGKILSRNNTGKKTFWA